MSQLQCLFINQFLLHFVRLGVKVFAEWKDKDLEVPSDWSEVLADLFNDEEYEAVAILAIGGCFIWPFLFVIIFC